MTDVLAPSMSPDVCQKEKEAVLNDRIEVIRKRNEDIKRRHEEVQADKRNATIMKQILLENSGSGLRMFAEEKIAARKLSANSNSSSKREWRALNNVGQPNDPDSETRPTVRSTEGNVAPPDPPFTYLTDRLRDGHFCSDMTKTRPRKRSNASDSGNSSIGSSRKTSTASDFSSADSHGVNYRKMSMAGETGDFFKRKTSDANSACSDGFWSRKTSAASDSSSYSAWSRKSSDCSADNTRGLNHCKYEVEVDDEGRVKVKVIPGTVMGQKRLVRRHASLNLLAPPALEVSPMSPEEKMAYENWRREREDVDHERMERQKTNQGSWKREWDNQKLDQESDEHISQESFFTRRMQRALEKEKEALEKERLAQEKEKEAKEKEEALEKEPKKEDAQPEDGETDKVKPTKTKSEKRQKPSLQELHSNWRERKPSPCPNGVVMKLADIIKELGIAKDSPSEQNCEAEAEAEIEAEADKEPSDPLAEAVEEKEEMENVAASHDDEGFEEEDHGAKSGEAGESETEKEDADLIRAVEDIDAKLSLSEAMVECNNNFVRHDAIETIYEADEETKEIGN